MTGGDAWAPHPDARERILARIRSALERRTALPHPGVAPAVQEDRGAEGEPAARFERFATALRQSGGEVVHLPNAEASASWLATFARGFAHAAPSPLVPAALRPALAEVEPSAADLGISVALAGAAATGSLLLSSTEGRALQLLPPVHLVWLEESRIYPELADALERVRASDPLPAALALHSGPSKSADIGRILVTGVHGPGRLVVAVTGYALR